MIIEVRSCGGLMSQSREREVRDICETYQKREWVNFCEKEGVYHKHFPDEDHHDTHMGQYLVHFYFLLASIPRLTVLASKRHFIAGKEQHQKWKWRIRVSSAKRRFLYYFSLLFA